MTNTSKTILFFGTDTFSAVSLGELIAKGFTIGAVITKPDTKKGRGRTLTKSAVKEVAEAHGIPVWQPVAMDEIIEKIEQVTRVIKEKPIGVLVSYGKIIPQAIINLFEPGIVNVHPSLLPKYRGPSPVESAILHGDTETGVTIMHLSAAMDAGPIYNQVTVPLNDTETAPELEKHLAELGAQQLSVTLPSIMSGALQPTPQHNEVATYCQLLRKEDGLLTAEKITKDAITAEQAERRVRAYLAYPKTKVTVTGQHIVVTKAHVTSPQALQAAEKQPSVLDLACIDGQFLTIDELIGPSGKIMDAKAFLNGYRTP
jgi:methionyl-tRNA formyltransferase